MPRKMDLIDIAAIERAVTFNATAFLGTGRYRSEAFPDLASARQAADRLADEAANGRRGMVYAQTPEGRSVFVPATYQPDEATQGNSMQQNAKGKARKADPAAAIAEQPPKEAKPLTHPVSKRTAILEAAQRGELPEPPDFSAETHTRFRPKLAKLAEMAAAGDIEGLKNEVINPVSSSPKAMAKYRDLAVIALEAKVGKN